MTWCWGHNGEGQLGDGTHLTELIPVASHFSGGLAVAAGLDTTCGLQQDGSVWCWGSNETGNLGAGLMDQDSPEPVRVVGVPAAAQVVVGGNHACALGQDGSVWCWGSTALGDGSSPLAVKRTAVQAKASFRATRLAAGSFFTCALAEDRTVWCWGSNLQGQLGDGTDMDRALPVQVAGLGDVVEVAAGGLFACARVQDGRVLCWGDNTAGQLGDGKRASRTRPAEVFQLGDATALAAGVRHACALRAGGWLWCWGANDSGQLGDGTTNARAIPGRVLDRVVAVTAGGPTGDEGHTCVLRADHAAWCWGLSNFGQLGTGAAGTTPAPVGLPLLCR